MRPFISRYPAFLGRSAEFRDIQQALEPELLDLWAARDSALDQLCAQTATWGLQYWEKTLGIPVDGEKDLDTRRGRVRVKLLGADVTTVVLVKSAAELWSGGPAEVAEYPNEFRFEITFSGYDCVPPNLRDFMASLRELVPAHLGWGCRFVYEVDCAPYIGAGGGLVGSRREDRAVIRVPPLKKPGGQARPVVGGALAGSRRQDRVEIRMPPLARPHGTARRTAAAGAAGSYRRVRVPVRNPFMTNRR